MNTKEIVEKYPEAQKAFMEWRNKELGNSYTHGDRRAFLAGYAEAASLPVQQAQPPRLQKAVPYDPLRRISHALSDQEAGASEQLAHIQQIVDEHYQKSAGRTDNA